MKPLLSKEEKDKASRLCKENPYKAMDLAEYIFNKLQMVSIREFAKLTKLSERTVYNHVKDAENSHYEIAIFCNDKYIPLKLNKELLA